MCNYWRNTTMDNDEVICFLRVRFLVALAICWRSPGTSLSQVIWKKKTWQSINTSAHNLFCRNSSDSSSATLRKLKKYVLQWRFGVDWTWLSNKSDSWVNHESDASLSSRGTSVIGTGQFTLAAICRQSPPGDYLLFHLPQRVVSIGFRLRNFKEPCTHCFRL